MMRRPLLLLTALLLTACSADPPASAAQFRDTVVPVLEARCAAAVCHGVTPSGLAAGEEPDPEGYTLRTDEDGRLLDWEAAYRASRRFINTAEAPAFSSLLRKPLPEGAGGPNYPNM